MVRERAKPRKFPEVGATGPEHTPKTPGKTDVSPEVLQKLLQMLSGLPDEQREVVVAALGGGLVH